MSRNDNKIKLNFVVIPMLTFILSVAGVNASIIYMQTFDGDGLSGLDGVAPTQASDQYSGQTWAAKAEFVETDGFVNKDAGGMLLPFNPEVNKVYTLSMHLKHAGTKYIALGFTKDPINHAKLDASNRIPDRNGLAFVLYGEEGAIRTYGGLKATNEIANNGTYIGQQWVWISIVIDTTGDGSSFTADFQIDGESITGGPQTIVLAVADINYAGIASYGKPSGGSPEGSAIDNFRLVEGLDECPPDPVEPEPTGPVVPIYFEAFEGDGSDGYDGVVPTIGDGTWAAKDEFIRTDGSVTWHPGGMLLPFEPELNKVYHLSVNMNHVGTKYLSLGFTKDPIDYEKYDTGNRFPNLDGLAWIIYGQGGTVTVYGGYGSSNEIVNTGTYVSGADLNLSVIINTSGGGRRFTADFLIDGQSITNGPQIVNKPVGNIHYVGMGSYGKPSGGSPAGSMVDNFYLTEGVHKTNVFAVIDAGVDMISWSGESVSLDPKVFNNLGQGELLTYTWTADPADGVLFLPGNNVEDPVLRITKPTDNPSVVELKLAVNKADSPEPNAVTDVLTIDVYDDECDAARLGQWLFVDYPLDLDSDCIINLKDLALMAQAWLDEYQYYDLSEMASTWLYDYKLAGPIINEVPVADLYKAIIALTDHIENTIVLSNGEMDSYKKIIDSESHLIGGNSLIIEACFNLVRAYETEIGPLFVESSPVQSFTRSSVVNDIHWAVFNVMQYIMDNVYTADNILKHEDLLDGYKFGSSAFFPGSVDPPADPNAVYTVPVNGSYPLVPYVRDIDKASARKPTGAYLAPGSIATVIVPSSLVGKGYQVRVGAYSWDHSQKPNVLRLDRVSLTYDIDSTEVKVANPLGGGIYIQVPYLADAGIVDIKIKNTVRAPYFSAKSFHMTTLQEWQDVERHHPGPTADFQSDKFMMQVPTSWIYALDDPVTLIEDWDRSCDVTNDLMGFPHIRGKETFYTQVDIQLRGNAFFPGYPTSNSRFDPDIDYGGNYGDYHVTGPQNVQSFSVFHEQGHGYLFTKFAGETESAVNLLHVPVMMEFGSSLNDAFRTSIHGSGYLYRTLDTTAACWMMCENFYLQQPMDQEEKKYQLKGHAKYVDIARLFGWDAVGSYWLSINEDFENDITWPRNCVDYDRVILRMCETANVDLRPLLHFWGIHPDDSVTLASDVAAANVPASPEIYDTLVRYKSLVPSDIAAYQAFAYAWWNDKQPRAAGTASNVYQTEAYHAVLWDTYDTVYSAQIETIVQGIIDLYFPGGRP